MKIHLSSSCVMLVYLFLCLFFYFPDKVEEPSGLFLTVVEEMNIRKHFGNKHFVDFAIGDPASNPSHVPNAEPPLTPPTLIPLYSPLPPASEGPCHRFVCLAIKSSVCVCARACICV